MDLNSPLLSELLEQGYFFECLILLAGFIVWVFFCCGFGLSREHIANTHGNMWKHFSSKFSQNKVFWVTLVYTSCDRLPEFPGLWSPETRDGHYVPRRWCALHVSSETSHVWRRSHIFHVAHLSHMSLRSILYEGGRDSARNGRRRILVVTREQRSRSSSRARLETAPVEQSYIVARARYTGSSRHIPITNPPSCPGK